MKYPASRETSAQAGIFVFSFGLLICSMIKFGFFDFLVAAKVFIFCLGFMNFVIYLPIFTVKICRDFLYRNNRRTDT